MSTKKCNKLSSIREIWAQDLHHLQNDQSMFIEIPVMHFEYALKQKSDFFLGRGRP